jgi:hypothetical protein
MRAAANRTCLGRRHRDLPEKYLPSYEARTPWLCDGTTLRFFRVVDIKANRGLDGFACNSVEIGGEIKFLTDELVNDMQSACAKVSYDSGTKRHYLWNDPH